ncbi:MAG TPA: tetratricopeptide repeat protein [Blastocatellia bacterium]|nr:tetratricopeptide repeat protein [Blastocatellia bacterium]
MDFRNTLYRLTGRGERERDNSGNSPYCPHETDVLAYLQAVVSKRERARLEKHFAGCDHCRELIALFTTSSAEPADETGAVPLSETDVKEQTARILAHIESAELNTGKASGERRKSPEAGRPKEGFYLPYPWLAAAALVVCAIAAGLVFYLTREPSAEEEAMQALTLAMKDGRRTPARISGGFAYSDYTVTRGEGQSDDLQLERALSKLQSAEKESAPPAARQALARVHLAFNKPENAKRALAILAQLAASGVSSAELFNDTGVAQFQLGRYEDSLASFNKALEKSPGYSEALFNRALVNEMLFNKSRADQERARYLEAAKNDLQSFIKMTSDEKWRAEAQRKLNSLQSYPSS